MKTPIAPEESQIPIGPQAAAQAAIEVEAVPDDGQAGAAPGAPPGAAPMDQETWNKTLKVAFGMLFAVAAARWKSFETTEEEIDALAEVWTPVCEKYFPGTVPIEMLA